MGGEDRGEGGKSVVGAGGGSGGVRTKEEYVLAVYLDKGLLAGKCENEALVGEHATAAFLSIQVWVWVRGNLTKSR